MNYLAFVLLLLVSTFNALFNKISKGYTVTPLKWSLNTFYKPVTVVFSPESQREHRDAWKSLDIDVLDVMLALNNQMVSLVCNTFSSSLNHSDLRFDCVNSSFSTVILVYSFSIFVTGKVIHMHRKKYLWWKIAVLVACWMHYKTWNACVAGAQEGKTRKQSCELNL